MSARLYRRMLLMLLIFVLSLGGGYGLIKLQQNRLQIPVNGESETQQYVIPGGIPIGIYLETEGVLVLGTEEIKAKDGTTVNPSKNLVKSGDYIVGIDKEEISDKKELISAVKKLQETSVVLHLRRDEEYIDVKVHPGKNEQGEYKLGIWVRDSAQGIGTVTYIKEDHSFGALGHGIHDIDTNELLEITEGTLYETSIQHIKKGKSGEPGGFEGVITYNNYNILGTISQNTEEGIFGKINRVDQILSDITPCLTADKDEIDLGAATIRCSLNGTVKEYSVRIIGLDYYAKEVNKGIMIQVDDSELLEATGGIVQGMSGCPIIQNGKLVGAVTHVLVNDPTKGYGIFIENMLAH